MEGGLNVLSVISSASMLSKPLCPILLLPLGGPLPVILNNVKDPCAKHSPAQLAPTGASSRCDEAPIVGYSCQGMQATN